MADKSFGIKELNLIGASGTPTITSPNNLNLNASNVAISTDVTVGRHLDVDGHAEFDNVNIAGVTTFSSAINVSSSYGTSGQVLTSQGSGSAPQWATPSSGWTLQGHSSISGSANIDFETFPAGINFVKIIVADVSASGSVSGNGILGLQLKQSGNVVSDANYDGCLRYNTSNQDRTNESKWALLGTSTVQNSTTAQFMGHIELIRMSGRWSVSANLQALVSIQGFHQFNGYFDGNGNDISGVRLSIEGTSYDAGQMTCYYM